MRGLCAQWGAALVASLALAGCVNLPPQPTYERPADQTAATSLRLGQRVTGQVRGPGSKHPRYLFKVLQPGLVSVALSWNHQEGMDRVLIQRGVSTPQELDCRERLKAEYRFQAEPGYHYLELIPGPEDASYDLVVVQEP